MEIREVEKMEEMWYESSGKNLPASIESRMYTGVSIHLPLAIKHMHFSLDFARPAIKCVVRREYILNKFMVSKKDIHFSYAILISKLCLKLE